MSHHSRNTNPQLPSLDGNSLSSQSDRPDQPDQPGRPVAEPQASGPAEAGAFPREIDWGQVVLNGGPPCFHIEEGGRYCLRAQRWIGHGHGTDTDHSYVSLTEMICSMESRARIDGFRDCEELVIGFLQREADKGRACTAEFALRSAALAIRLGQYKDVEDVEP